MKFILVLIGFWDLLVLAPKNSIFNTFIFFWGSKLSKTWRKRVEKSEIGSLDPEREKFEGYEVTQVFGNAGKTQDGEDEANNGHHHHVLLVPKDYVN